tara:strand:+ start:542 stop:1249 length:708 start_codon:yes stop_codon:yes gene_type:complete
MGFQTGSTIDPRLMKMDYSGFTNAASIRAQAMSELGQQVGSFITKFDKDQQIKKEKADFQSAILPELMDMAKGDEEKAKGYAKMLANNPDAFKAVMEYKGIEREQEKADMTLKALNAVATGTMKPEEALAMGIPVSDIKGAMDLTKTKPVTYSQVQGVSKLMQEQFSDVKVDESTGETYMKVPKTGDYIPFNTERVPANIPDGLRNMPGFDEWKKSKMSPSSSRDYSSMGMSVVK